MRTVTAPDGSEHTVQILWVGNRLRRAPLELRRRVSRAGRRTAAGADGGCFPDVDAIAAVVAVVVVVFVLIVGLPALFFLVEVVVIVLAAACVWAARILFRRPWQIVHIGPGDVRLEACLVPGWRRAHRVMVEAAGEVASTGTARATFGATSTIS